MTKPITIPIKSHTKVRRPMSRWLCGGTTAKHQYHHYGKVTVQDIKTGLENPLELWPKQFNMRVFSGLKKYQEQQKGDWSVTLTEMSGFEAGDKLVMKKVKPSLLTKLKNKLRRK